MKSFTPINRRSVLDTPGVRLSILGDVYMNAALGQSLPDGELRYRIELHIDNNDVATEARFVPDREGFIAIPPGPTKARLMRCRKFTEQLASSYPKFPFDEHLSVETMDDGVIALAINGR